MTAFKGTRIRIVCCWVASVTGGSLWRFFFFQQAQQTQKHMHTRRMTNPTLTPPPTIGSRGMVPVPLLTSGQTRDRHEKENKIHDPVILTFCEGYKYYI